MHTAHPNPIPVRNRSINVFQLQRSIGFIALIFLIPIGVLGGSLNARSAEGLGIFDCIEADWPLEHRSSEELLLEEDLSDNSDLADDLLECYGCVFPFHRIHLCRRGIVQIGLLYIRNRCLRI